MFRKCRKMKKSMLTIFIFIFLTDNTLDILKEYHKKNPRLLFYVNKVPLSKFRTHRIAISRNYCLKYIRENLNLQLKYR